MRIIISGWSFELTDAMAELVERRVRYALGTAADDIVAVSVRLDDVAGALGGGGVANGNGNGHGCDGRGDVRCRVVVWLRHLRTVVVEAVDRDLSDAVDEAVARAKDAVWRNLGRRRRTTSRQQQQIFNAPRRLLA